MLRPCADLTLLDKYVICCLFVIFLVALEGGVMGVVWQAVAPNSPEHPLLTAIDMWLNLALIVLFGLVHLYFMSPVLHPMGNRQNKHNLHRGGFKVEGMGAVGDKALSVVSITTPGARRRVMPT